jgi:hypothetical protein
MCDISCKHCLEEMDRLLAISDPVVAAEVFVLCSECSGLNVLVMVDGHAVLRQATPDEKQGMLLDRDYQRAIFALARARAGRN